MKYKRNWILRLGIVHSDNITSKHIFAILFCDKSVTLSLVSSSIIFVYLYFGSLIFRYSMIILLAPADGFCDPNLIRSCFCEFVNAM